MKYLVVDALLHGTGIRDKYNGGYIAPEDLGLSDVIKDKLKAWLAKYAAEHYNGFVNNLTIEELDNEGMEITLLIRNELSDVKLEYFSDARMTTQLL